VRLDPGALGVFALAFLLVFYLAMRGGGYDPVVRGEVGVAVWWIVLLGVAVGVLPRAPLGRAAWLGLGLLGAVAVWTALALTWTESDERTATELARVATHVGFLAVVLIATGRRSIRYAVGGVAAAVSVVALVALLSRLHPAWFSASEHARFLPSAANRLSYPLDYWNGLAAFIGIGVPPVLAAAVAARSVVLQALAAAALPMLALTSFLTLSRTGAAAIVLGVLVYVVLTPRRLAALASLVPAAAGSVILILGLTQRDALQAAADTPAAHAQGDDLLLMCAFVCVGVALVQVAIGLVQRFVAAPRLVERASAHRRIGFALAAAFGVAVLLAAGAPSWVEERWDAFKEPALSGGTAEPSRLLSSTGAGRYQFWQAAVDAGESRPLSGRGPGTYEYWWARHGELDYFVRDAHSLYLQTFAEAGWIGLLLLGGFLVLVVGSGVVRSLRAAAEDRPWLAGATAGAVAFCLAAGLDWVWNIAAIPAAFLVLAAVLLHGPSRERATGKRETGKRAIGTRVALVAASILALVAIGGPLLGSSALHESTAAAAGGDVERALDEAGSAGRAQPYAASPALQEALLLEQRGEIPAAVVAVRKATAEEPTNWRTWLVRSRLEGRNGSAGGALAAYRKAKSLNPRSPIFKAP
jgi:hypothetical protein